VRAVLAAAELTPAMAPAPRLAALSGPGKDLWQGRSGQASPPDPGRGRAHHVDAFRWLRGQPVVGFCAEGGQGPVEFGREPPVGAPALARHPGQVLTRRQLLQTVWGPDYYGDDRVVDVHIRTLRKALRDDAANPAYIAAIRSIGYRLITPTPAQARVGAVAGVLVRLSCGGAASRCRGLRRSTW
jgi:hypothetical protein